jgi:hypothetical protein
MRFIFCVISIFLCLPALFAAGEKSMSLNGASGWGDIKVQSGITKIEGLRPLPVLSISSSFAKGKKPLDPNTDLYLSFDEGKVSRFSDSAFHYSVQTTDKVQLAENRWAWRGGGAALFSGVSNVSYQNTLQKMAPIIVSPLDAHSLFAAGRNIDDFSIEFDIYPNLMASGEYILGWQANVRNYSTDTDGRTKIQNSFQSIVCRTERNRLNWDFTNFFAAPDGKSTKDISFNSNTPLTPKTWSHHLVRFDASSGLLEYVVNGVLQSVLYVTSQNREGGDVFTPVAGDRGSLFLGENFTGLLDEFKISNAFVVQRNIERYSDFVGRIETNPLDLGDSNSELKKIDISGGSFKFLDRKVQNEYTRNGDFRFSDNTQIQFFVRIAPTAVALERAEWMAFKGGESFFSLKGRFVQIAADFYPSGNLDASPYIEEIKLEYKNYGAPPPPEKLYAVAHDGSVDLSWKTRPDVAGYVVYYGTKKGEYFCEDASLGASPIDVGKVGSVRLDNLKNGTLYYFTVAAYDAYHGEGSREVTARPLKMIE